MRGKSKRGVRDGSSIPVWAVAGCWDGEAGRRRRCWEVGIGTQLYKHHVEMNIRYVSEAAAWKGGPMSRVWRRSQGRLVWDSSTGRRCLKPLNWTRAQEQVKGPLGNSVEYVRSASGVLLALKGWREEEESNNEQEGTAERQEEGTCA